MEHKISKGSCSSLSKVYFFFLIVYVFLLFCLQEICFFLFLYFCLSHLGLVCVSVFPRLHPGTRSTKQFSFWSSVQFCSVALLCPTLCDPMDFSTPGFPVHHQLLKLAQTHVHRICDAIQPSHPLSSPSTPALNLSQHQGLFKWVSSSHQVAKVLELQLQHQSFQ